MGFSKKRTEDIKIVVEGEEYNIQYKILSDKKQKEINKKFKKHIKELERGILTIQKALSIIEDDKKLDEFISTITNGDIVRAIQLEREIVLLKEDELNNLDEIYKKREAIEEIQESLSKVKDYKKEAFLSMVSGEKADKLADYYADLDEEDTKAFNEYLAEVYRETRKGKLKR